MKVVDYTREKVIRLFEDGETIKLCSGLWNNPLTKSTIAKSIQEINNFFDWASKVEVKLNDNPADKTIYIHGYSVSDMF